MGCKEIEVTKLVFLLGECWLLTFTSGGGDDDGARSKEETVTTRAKAFPSHVGSRMGLPDIGVSMKCRRPDALEFTRAVSMLIFLGMVPNLWRKRVDTEDRLAGCYCHGNLKSTVLKCFTCLPPLVEHNKDLSLAAPTRFCASHMDESSQSQRAISCFDCLFVCLSYAS